MSAQTAKKGDLAVFGPWVPLDMGDRCTPQSRGCPQRNRHIQMAVSVLTDPAPAYDLQTWPRADLLNKISAPCGCVAWVANKWLIPIRDPDAGVSNTADREVTA